MKTYLLQLRVGMIVRAEDEDSALKRLDGVDEALSVHKDIVGVLAVDVIDSVVASELKDDVDVDDVFDGMI